MATATAAVPTANGSRYMQQLCKHWSHKFEVTFDAAQGRVTFPEATVIMTAEPEALAVVLDADDAGVLERMKDVVASHLDRFAFREAPLTFRWLAA
ncbi:DUF2218 domain-containing protein [Sphingosinicella microcystinivorans]|jgi:uncharacterized protein|uniref:DUF2218 domain-containing protein n=1 Tax=Sphingosinicella microcystinivorans TaxID=335406 RepID=A0AAD1D5Z3_SPHMI|nr:DUF2218 domain-containing protein [Sphingosinicella microcystinivorans]RKS91041.1 hypothetical protein DFR51_0588 [Sphingosinicella microcystinivorans]BBE33962.1 hypothetical protein SmB9_16200 [Sphingosinicella microcystinivorans]